MKALGADDTEISLPVSVVKKAIEKHNLSAGEINRAIMKLYDPIFAFEKEEGENQKPSLLMVTYEFHYVNNNPLVPSLNINDEIKIKHHTAEVQDVRTIFDKTLTAQDGTNLIDYWTRQGYCRYVDDKKITDWNTVSRNLFPIEVLQSANNNILSKSALVNEQKTQKEITPAESPFDRVTKQYSEKYKDFFNGNDGLVTSSLYLSTGIGSYNQGNFSTSRAKMPEYIDNRSMKAIKLKIKHITLTAKHIPKRILKNCFMKI